MVDMLIMGPSVVHLRKERSPNLRKSKLLPRGDKPFNILRSINNNAYVVNMPQEYEGNNSFNILDLSTFCVSTQEPSLTLLLGILSVTFLLFSFLSFLDTLLYNTVGLSIIGRPTGRYENRPPSRVASGADSSSSDGLQSSSSSGEVFPFEIWYRDNSEDDVSEDAFSWVDKEVKRAFSQYTQGSLLLGMMKKLLRPGPWRVRFRHCRPDESVNNRASSEETPFFYVYEPVFSKLGLKLPFTSFEQTILRAINVAPTQLHPNSWAFIRAFELLCEDLGRAPSLGVFFWFFRVKKTPKVCPGKSSPSLMADPSGTPFFPFYWTSQPAVSITIVRKDLERWEDEFISELETLPRLFCSELIRGSGFSVKLLKDLKKNMPPTAEEGASAAAEVPQAAVPLQEIPADPSPPSAGSEAVADWSAKGPEAEEDIIRRPSKRPHLEEEIEPQDELGRPSHSVWVRSKFISEAVDQNVLTPSEGSLVKRLGVSGTLDAIQRLASCSAILARATELAQVDEERQVWDQTRTEYDDQLDLLKKFVAALQEELQRSADHHAYAQDEWASRQDVLAIEAECAKAKISSLESDVAALQSRVAVQEDEMKVKDATISQQGAAMVKQYEYGFNHALAQAKILHPGLDLSGTDPYKEIVDGQIVDVP
ncbi:hypothetical protein CR513_06812, partial [Mucuna pruriens]